MSKVSIIVPVIRPVLAHNLFTVIHTRAGIPKEDYEIVHAEDKERIGAPKMVKMLVERTKYDLVMFLGDDCIPQQDFLKNAIKTMNSLPDKWGLVGLNDMRRPLHEAPTHWLGHKKLLKYCGEFFHTGYIHLYCDNELFLWAMLLERYKMAKDAKIKHNHIGFIDDTKDFHQNIDEGDDEDYKRVYSFDVKEHDEMLFEKRYDIIIKTMAHRAVKEKISKITGGHKPGSSMENKKIYHDLPYRGMKNFVAHRGKTQQRTDQILSLVKDHVIDTALDIGCNVGGLTIGIKLKGINAHGIDHDDQSIEVAKEAARKMGLEMKFDVAETNLDWAKKLDDYDLIVWMSQWMWLVKQYGLPMAQKIMFEVSKKAERMVFESGASDGMAPIKGATQDDIEKWLREHTVYQAIERHPGVGGWAKRDVFYCYDSNYKSHGEVAKVERLTHNLIRKTFNEKYIWQKDREIKALNMMAKYDVSPKVISFTEDSILMEYVGHHMGEPIKTSPKYRTRVNKIKECLILEKIKHRDFREAHLLLHNGVLKLIDFGWCLFENEIDTPIPAPKTLYAKASGNYT